MDAANAGNLELRDVWFSYPLRPQSGGAQALTPGQPVGPKWSDHDHLIGRWQLV